MSPDGSWDRFLEEHGEDRPTHRLRFRAEVELDVVLPPWVTPEDAARHAVAVTGDDDVKGFGVDSYGFPQYLPRGPHRLAGLDVEIETVDE